MNFTQDFTHPESAVKEAIESKLKELGYEMQMICRLSNHPNDDYLWLVLAYENGRSIYESNYVTWTCNVNNGRAELFYGHYDLTFKEALEIISDKLIVNK